MYEDYLYDISNSSLNFEDYGFSSDLSSTLPSDLSSSDALSSLGGILAVFFVAYLFVLIICGILAIIKYIGAWKMYKKAGIDGWEALIPVHNLIVEFKLAGIQTYWYFLLLIPIANIIIICWKDIALAKAYGKGTGFGIGLFFLNPIFTAILGLGKSKYVGPQSANSTNGNQSYANTNSGSTPQQPVQESLFNNNSDNNSKD